MTPARSGAAASSAPGLRYVPGLEEPLAATGLVQPQAERDLDAALEAFRDPAVAPRDFAERAQPLRAFLQRYPDSPWRLALLTNLGLGYYHAGYFSLAVTAWEDAWHTGRHATAPEAKALADRAVGELARMHARVGHAEELARLFQEIGDRPVSGPATELITGAREGLWMFRHDPGVSYLCGPKALQNLLFTLKAKPERVRPLDEVRSGRHGFSLEQVAQLADQAGLAHRLIYRTPEQPIPVPAIIHWKLQHYAALIEERDGLYRLQDPTFASGDQWVTKAAIDAEASGYFLIPAPVDPVPNWRLASLAEARRVYGRGYTSSSQPGATTPADLSLRPPCDGHGMCVANAKSMLVSLNLNDTPVGYQPPIGPPVAIRLTYNQRESAQPANFGFFNVSPKWTLNVLSYVQDHPQLAGRSVLRYVAGGGSIDYSSGYSYDSASGAFSPERQGQAVLVRIPATGPVAAYELRQPDGSKQVFSHSDGATSAPRRIFLTQVVDAAGNALTLHYDAQLRLTSITDAIGRETTFSYGLTDKPLLVTQITDPFGRHAALRYDASGRLAAITDVLGLTSSFTYDAAGLVKAMTTPYGASRFAYGQNTGSNLRYLEMTDPLGFTERLEFRHRAPKMASSDPVAPADLGVNNLYLYYRNTFHWDKYLYPITHTDYSKAHITHWLHNPSGQTSPIVESTKAPLERRVWNVYPNQIKTYHEGSAANPVAIARVLDDGTTQARTFTYNRLGKPLTVTDPLGRKTVFTYDANDIDLLTVQQQTASGSATLARFTYNAQHRPLSYTDAAGQVTQFAYNAAGQLTRVTDALGHAMGYAYDPLGRLVTVTNANGIVQESLTYDAFDRVATRTDSEGHTLAYRYDPLDRLTQIAYPDGTTTTYAYDRLDLAAVTDRLGRTTTYTHDANRRLTAVTDALGQVTRYAYYPNGALQSLTDPQGRVTTWDIDIEGRPTAKRYADGSTETYRYEPTTSRLATRTDALNQITAYAYFPDDRLQGITYPGAVNPTDPVQFAYDPDFPRLTLVTDGVGATTFRYHPTGQPGALQLALEDGPFAEHDTIAYTYDALGRVTTRTVDRAPETFTYDALGRPIRHHSALGRFRTRYLGETEQIVAQVLARAKLQTRYAYADNAQDRRLRAIRHPAGRSFRYTTDAAQRITRVSERAPEAGRIGAFAAALASPWASDATSHSGANATVTSTTWEYTYDETDRLLDANATVIGPASPKPPPPRPGHHPGRGDPVGEEEACPPQHPQHPAAQDRSAHRPSPPRHSDCHSHPERDHNQAWDRGGQRDPSGLAADHHPSSAGATAPAARSLIRSTTRYSYAYDPSDNLTIVDRPTGLSTARYNDVNQITDWNGQPFRYDAAGNLLDDGERTYQWDAENRLIAIGYPATPGKTTTFRYDGLGRRVAILESDGLSTTESRYLWCGRTLCQARDGSDRVTRRYFPEGEVDPVSGHRLVYARDHLGSVRHLLDADFGTRLATYEYDPYGNPTASEGPASSDLRYAGMLQHAESGLYLTPYRAYDPKTARWLSRDPIGEAGSSNLYAYVNNNPVNLTDPTGLCPWCVAWAIYEIGSSLYDTYNAFATLNDGCATDAEQFTALGGALLGILAPGGGYGTVGQQVVKGAVIGRMEDLMAPGAIKHGEYTLLDRLPNLGNPKSNYYQNMSVLRKEMRNGTPIRDLSGSDTMLAPTKLSPHRTIRQTFTGAERNQLRNKGWTFDGEYWHPPAR